MKRSTTLGELRESGYQVLSVKEEMRRNLIGKIRAGAELFPGIVGYEETVIPQLENAILSGQDVVLLGLQRLRRIIGIDVEGRTATVEPGVVNASLTKAARPEPPEWRIEHDQVESPGDVAE